MDFIPELVYCLDLEGRLTWWNRRLEAVTGLAPEVLEGRPALAFFPKGHWPTIVDGIRRALLGEDAEAEADFLGAGGVAIPYQFLSARLMDGAGRPAGIVVVGRDITQKRLAEAELRQARDGLERRVKERTANLEAALNGLELEIAERKRAEERVRRSEQRYRFLADAMPQVVWTATPDGQVDYFNRCWSEMTGLPPGEYGGGCWLPFIHPDDRGRVLREWEESVQSGTPFQATYRTSDLASGEYRWQLVRAVPARGEDGRIEQWVGSMSDIDDQKRTEDTSRESEARFRTLTEAMPQLVWSATADGRIDYLSRQCAEYTGILEADQLGSGWTDALHFDDRERVRTTWKDAVEGAGTYALEYRIRAADGSYRWFQSRGVPLRDGQGRVVQWLGTCTDIHDRKQAEEALRRAHDQLETKVRERTSALERANAALQSEVAERSRAEDEARERQRFIERLAEANPSILYLYDLDERRNVWVNRRIADVLGHGLERIAALGNQLMPRLLHPDDVIRLGSEDVQSRLGSLADGQVIELEYRMRHADGSWRWLRSRELVFRRDEAGRPVQVIGAAEDVTERKRAEETFRVIFEKSSHPHLLYDPEQGIVDCNEATLRMFRCPDRLLLVGIHPDFFASEAQPDGVPSAERRVDHDCRARQQGTCRFDWTARRFDGEEFPCEVTITTVEVAGWPLLLCVWHDMSERVRAEQALRDSEQRLRGILDGIPAVVGLYATDGSLLEVNRAMLELDGWRREEVLGKSLFDLAIPLLTSLEELQALFTRATQGETIEAEMSMALPDGRTRVMQGTLSPLRDATGRIDRVLISARDVSERVWAEQALRDSEQRLRAVLDAAVDGIIRVDEAGVIESANPAACRLFGYPAEALIGRSVATLMPSPGAARLMLRVARIARDPSGIAGPLGDEARDRGRRPLRPDRRPRRRWGCALRPGLARRHDAGHGRLRSRSRHPPRHRGRHGDPDALFRRPR